jgi:hypothetical protein
MSDREDDVRALLEEGPLPDALDPPENVLLFPPAKAPELWAAAEPACQVSTWHTQRVLLLTPEQVAEFCRHAVHWTEIRWGFR